MEQNEVSLNKVNELIEKGYELHSLIEGTNGDSECIRSIAYANMIKYYDEETDFDIGFDASRLERILTAKKSFKHECAGENCLKLIRYDKVYCNCCWRTGY